MSITLLNAGWIIPMAAGTGTLEKHTLVMDGERIAALLPWAQAAAHRPACAAQPGCRALTLEPLLRNSKMPPAWLPA